MKVKKVYQQGDVLFKLVDKFDKTRLTEVNTRTIQEGEVTGHSHVIEGNEVAVYEDDTRNKFVSILAEAVLKHEEHRPINLPAGDYVIGIVREQDHLNNSIRRVVD